MNGANGMNDYKSIYHFPFSVSPFSNLRTGYSAANPHIHVIIIVVNFLYTNIQTLLIIWCSDGYIHYTIDNRRWAVDRRTGSKMIPVYACFVVHAKVVEVSVEVHLQTIYI